MRQVDRVCVVVCVYLESKGVCCRVTIVSRSHIAVVSVSVLYDDDVMMTSAPCIAQQVRLDSPRRAMAMARTVAA